MAHRFWLVTLLVWAGCYVETPTYSVSGAIEQTDADPIFAVDAAVPGEDAAPEVADADVDEDAASEFCACDAAAPVCIETTGECVQCTKSEADACQGDTPVCYVPESQCVGCLLNADCTTPEASACGDDLKCAGCSTDADCAHIEGQNVCADGQCVECTADDPSACLTPTGDPAVCDNRSHSCTEYAVGGVSQCEECISDAQCEEGQACVELLVPGSDPEESAGFFCQWSLGPSEFSDCRGARPFSETLSAVSIDHPDHPVSVCTLGGARTCADFHGSEEPCGRYKNGPLDFIVASNSDEQIPLGLRGPDEAGTKIRADDSVCGPSSSCEVKDEASSRYFCAMPCIAPEDCHKGRVCIQRFCR